MNTKYSVLALLLFLWTTPSNIAHAQQGQQALPAPSESELLVPTISYLHIARKTFGTAVIDGKVYVSGGHGGPSHSRNIDHQLQSTEVYDPETQEWQTLEPRIHSAYGYGMVSYDDQLVAFGGFSYQRNDSGIALRGSASFIEAFDPAVGERGRWQVRPTELPDPRSSHRVVALDNLVYLIGGWQVEPNKGMGPYVNNVDVYDLTKQEFVPSAHHLPALSKAGAVAENAKDQSENPGMRAFAACSTPNNTIIVAGGNKASPGGLIPMNKVMEFDPTKPADKAWRTLPDLPVVLFGPSATVTNGWLVVAGGYGGQEGAGHRGWKYRKTVHGLRYKEPGATWRVLGHLSEGKGFTETVTVDSRRFMVIGGNIVDPTRQVPSPRTPGTTTAFTGASDRAEMFTLNLTAQE